MQVKLLRVLQEKRFMPLGSNREIEVNVRIIAATNRNLEEMVQLGTFREDLFYRLNVLPINLPPLRDRSGDIESLISYFIEKFGQQYQKKITRATPEVMDLLKAHTWPGNIRELENVIEHAFVIETTSELKKESLPTHILSGGVSPEDAEALLSLEPGKTGQGFRLDINKLDFQANKEEFERQFLMNALQHFKGRINQTALHANIPKKTLLRKLEKYGITAKDYIDD